MKLTYSADIDAAYLYLSQIPGGARHQREVQLPNGSIVLDLDEAGHLLGIEFLVASAQLTPEILASAEPPKHYQRPFSNMSEELTCGKEVIRGGYTLACMRRADHAGECISMVGHAAAADGVCFYCRQPIEAGHHPECDLVADLDGHRWCEPCQASTINAECPLCGEATRRRNEDGGGQCPANVHRINAAEFVGRGLPTDEGRNLARGFLALVNGSIERTWDVLEIDLSDLPPARLISAFFNAFLQEVLEQDLTKFYRARRVNWITKYPFQATNIEYWVAQFTPPEPMAPTEPVGYYDELSNLVENHPPGLPRLKR